MFLGWGLVQIHAPDWLYLHCSKKTRRCHEFRKEVGRVGGLPRADDTEWRPGRELYHPGGRSEVCEPWTDCMSGG